MRLLRLLRSCGLLLVLLACGLSAAETAPAPPPAVVVVIDGARSTGADPAMRDRLRLVTDHLLPASRRLWLFDREAKAVDALGDAAFKSRQSDYLRAFASAIAPAAKAAEPSLLILAGDGQVEIVGTAPDKAYADLIKAGATREVINRAAAAKLREESAAAIAAAHIRFLVLDAATAPEDSSLWSWLQTNRADTRRLSLRRLLLSELVPALAEAGVKPDGLVLGGTVQVLAPGSPAAALDLPEGSPRIDVFINALGDDAGYAVAVAAGGSPLPAEQVQEADADGPARHLVLTGLDAGAALSIGMSGSDQGYEVLAVAHPAFSHKLAVQADSDDGRLYAGDKLAVAHQFTRGPGATAISATTKRDLLAAAGLVLDGKSQPSTAQVDLPAEPGKGTLALVPGGPLAPWIASEPLTLTWTALEPMVLTGGFDKPKSIEGGRVGLQMTLAGGRRTPASLPLALTRDDGRTMVITLAPLPGQARTFAVDEHSFAKGDRGVWTVDAKQNLPGGDAASVAGAGRTLVIDVSRDWLPIILLALLILAIIGGLLLWWWMTRPRFTTQVLEDAHDLKKLSAFPGPAAGTSWGITRFDKAVLFTVTAQGVTVAPTPADPRRPQPAIRLFVNGRETTAAVRLASGNDIEAVFPDGNRVHARFWTSGPDLSAWSTDRAQIDLGRDFAAEHVIIEP